MKRKSYHYSKKSNHKGKIHPLIILGFILLVGLLVIAGFYLKRKLVKPETYKPTEKTKLIDIPKIIQNTGKIEVHEVGTSALLPGAKWVPQTFNNCAPATTSMILQYFNYSVGQDITKADLRTNDDDKNVFTYEIRDYLKSKYDIDSKLFYNGDIERIKLLLANGFYVLLEDWLHPNEDIGHVTIIRGFDDAQGVFIADDSYIGVNIVYKYDEFDKTQWKAFNREYLPIYKAEQEKLLMEIIGEDWDEDTMFRKAVERAKAEIVENDKDMYAYFNLGTSYYALGQYEEAKEAFEKSRALGWPRRMLWYQIQPVQTLNELGDYKGAIEMADIGLVSNDSFAELHVEKAKSYIGLGDKDKARQEAEKAIFYSPDLESAHEIISSL